MGRLLLEDEYVINVKVRRPLEHIDKLRKIDRPTVNNERRFSVPRNSFNNNDSYGPNDNANGNIWSAKASGISDIAGNITGKYSKSFNHHAKTSDENRETMKPSHKGFPNLKPHGTSADKNVSQPSKPSKEGSLYIERIASHCQSSTGQLYVPPVPMDMSSKDEFCEPSRGNSRRSASERIQHRMTKPFAPGGHTFQMDVQTLPKNYQRQVPSKETNLKFNQSDIAEVETLTRVDIDNLNRMHLKDRYCACGIKEDTDTVSSNVTNAVHLPQQSPKDSPAACWSNNAVLPTFIEQNAQMKVLDYLNKMEIGNDSYTDDSEWDYHSDSSTTDACISTTDNNLSSSPECWDYLQNCDRYPYHGYQCGNYQRHKCNECRDHCDEYRNQCDEYRNHCNECQDQCDESQDYHCDEDRNNQCIECQTYQSDDDSQCNQYSNLVDASYTYCGNSNRVFDDSDLSRTRSLQYRRQSSNSSNDFRHFRKGRFN